MSIVHCTAEADMLTKKSLLTAEAYETSVAGHHKTMSSESSYVAAFDICIHISCSNNSRRQKMRLAFNSFLMGVHSHPLLTAKRTLCLLLLFEQLMNIAAFANYIWSCHIQPHLFRRLLQVENTF